MNDADILPEFTVFVKILDKHLSLHISWRHQEITSQFTKLKINKSTRQKMKGLKHLIDDENQAEELGETD